MSEPEFVRVLSLGELDRGEMRAVQVGSREILLCRTRDGVFALDNFCTHARQRMDEGELRRSKLICPLHGAVFDVRTGAVLSGPAILSLRTYPVRLVGESIEVQLPAAAGSAR